MTDPRDCTEPGCVLFTHGAEHDHEDRQARIWPTVPVPTNDAILDAHTLRRCPVHGIPDCSPLLNGCSIPNRLHAALDDARRAGVTP